MRVFSTEIYPTEVNSHFRWKKNCCWRGKGRKEMYQSK